MSNWSKDDHARRVKENWDKMLKMEDPGERLTAWMEFFRSQQQDADDVAWMTGCLPHLAVHSWSLDDPKQPRVTLSYTVQPQDSNRAGNMHGGCAASLFDHATTIPLCLVSKPGFWLHLGVTRTLNVTYLRPIPIGEKILIECEVMAIGKTMCTIRGVMKRASDGAVLNTCEHGKYNNDPPVTPKSKL